MMGYYEIFMPSITFVYYAGFLGVFCSECYDFADKNEVETVTSCVRLESRVNSCYTSLTI